VAGVLPFTGSWRPAFVPFVLDARSDDSETVSVQQLDAVLPAVQVLNVKAPPYNAKGDGVSDDTIAIQRCVTDAFAMGGSVFFPLGDYLITETLTTPNRAGCVALLGAGVHQSLSAGNSGDPIGRYGSKITFAGNAGDIVLASVTTPNLRQYVRIEKLCFQGNVAKGTSGHGLHFQCGLATSAVLVTLRDVVVNGASGNGVYADGNVFESLCENCRFNQCGDRGFRASANRAGAPGQWQLTRVTCQGNRIGIDIGGGGFWTFTEVDCIANTVTGLIVTGTVLTAVGLGLEVNGPSNGTQGSFSNCFNLRIMGVFVTCIKGATGVGLQFSSVQASALQGYFTNSGVTGTGYRDFVLDDGCTRILVNQYLTTDFTDRFTVGHGGGHSVCRAQQWLTSQGHSQQTISVPGGGTATPTPITNDDVVISVTSPGRLTVPDPFPVSNAFMAGMRLVIEIFNNTDGSIATTWGMAYHLAGAWTDPAAGKRRVIQFKCRDRNGATWIEMSRSAGDIT